MKNYALTILLISCIGLSAQSIKKAEGFISDRDTKIPLAFCSIALKDGNKGTISNQDGFFSIQYENESDILTFYYLGYKTKTIKISELKKGMPVLLIKQSIQLDAITINADNSYLYELLTDCRKRIKQSNKKLSAKAFYVIESSTKNKPVELLECYYNAQIEGSNVKSLDFKNARTALAAIDGNYFQTFNTAKAISKLSLTKNEGLFPFSPLQLNKRKLKRKYILTNLPAPDNVVRIGFEPKKDRLLYFSGEVWIHKKELRILKIKLLCEHAAQHPFLPIHNTDSIYNLRLEINKSFSKYNETAVPDFTQFEYSFDYTSVRKSVPNTAGLNRILKRKIKSNGIVDYYDYNKAFILPYFSYPDNLAYGDYHIMTFIPYNPEFWKNNQQISLTRQQKQNLGFLADKGQLINYFDLNSLPRSADQRKPVMAFAFNYPFWSEKKRINIRTQMKNELNLSNTRRFIREIKMENDTYFFDCQILLDIDQKENSYYWKSYSVFDSYHSYFRIEQDEYTRAVLNIYFDLCEIARREMEKKLRTKNHSLSEINAIYRNSVKQMKVVGDEFLEEVRLGANNKALIKWNQKVLNELGIDNLKGIQSRQQAL